MPRRSRGRYQLGDRTILTNSSDRVKPVRVPGIEVTNGLVVFARGDVMSSIRQILRKLLVVGMIPFILGAGLPQMECKCAATKGQLFCECCFRKPDE